MLVKLNYFSISSNDKGSAISLEVKESGIGIFLTCAIFLLVKRYSLMSTYFMLCSLEREHFYKWSQSMYL